MPKIGLGLGQCTSHPADAWYLAGPSALGAVRHRPPGSSAVPPFAAQRGSRLRRGSAFVSACQADEDDKGETKDLKCQEGYHCVSRVRRFGTNHVGEAIVDLSAVSPTTEDYEWKCPYRGGWSASQYEMGQEDSQCKTKEECLCVAPSSPNGKSTLRDGVEKITGTFRVQPDCKGKTTKEEELTVIPHYKMRKIPQGVDPRDPYTRLGQTVTLPRDAFLIEFKDNAPKLQRFLDQLYQWLGSTYATKVQHDSFRCNQSGVSDEHSFTSAEVEDALARIRRFRIMSAECADLRDTIGKLAPLPPDQRFAEGASLDGKKLNCYTQQDSEDCYQLNCYSGPEDKAFRASVRELESKLGRCQLEQAASAGGASPSGGGETGAADAAAVEAGAEHGGAEPPAQEDSGGGAQADPTKQSLATDLLNVAVAVLTPRDIAPSTASGRRRGHFL